MRKIMAVVVVVGLGLLSGCAQVGKFTEQDAVTAAAVNPTNAACYNELGALGAAQAAATGTPGVLTIAATKMQLAMVLKDPNCIQLTTAVLTELLKVGVPGAAIILP